MKNWEHGPPLFVFVILGRPYKLWGCVPTPILELILAGLKCRCIFLPLRCSLQLTNGTEISSPAHLTDNSKCLMSRVALILLNYNKYHLVAFLLHFLISVSSTCQDEMVTNVVV